MYSLKTPSFLKPTSRPTSPSPPIPSPKPDPIAAPDRTTRSISKLSFPNFKRTASPLTQAPASLVHDGSYMEVLGLRLSEAVSKALSQPTAPAAPHELLGGRRPIPAGRGRALGELIASDDPHLYRAVLRTLHRPLSVLVTNVSGNLLPLIASPAFLSPAVPTPQLPNPNATQLHALGLATFAGELLDAFDELGLGQDSDMRGDGLKGVRDNLVSSIKRVIDPLVAGIKSDLMPHIEALELPASNAASKATGATKAAIVHPSIAYMQTTMPIYARALARYITSRTAETSLASLLISLVWRGLVSLSNRPPPLPGMTPPGSPPLLALTKSKSKEAKRRGSSVTPPNTPPAGRFTLKLPPSRPPSPPGLSSKVSSAATDARALFDLLNSLPRPTNELAREAVCDAFDSLSGLVALLEFVQSRKYSVVPASELERELDMITVDLSTLIALPVLLRAFVYPSSPSSSERTVAGMLGLTDGVYRSGCLSGFGRAEECVVAAGQRVLGVLRSELTVDSGKESEVVLRWLEREVAEAVQLHH
ncbi:hypothetical protein PHLCEN_2v141 [Hermanssonia centrifuga]|uniref:Uncharacterized protein n=1 Tax=Hermanssonia centrifuga TaxID=98765 RepID=A0A2R6S704_9APHY|nr:hypothetical protein PHLCEN_2v141 [Hermanssonia centrifuga]